MTVTNNSVEQINTALLSIDRRLQSSGSSSIGNIFTGRSASGLDWDNAISLTKDDVLNGWTAPENGILVGFYAQKDNVYGAIRLTINGVFVANSFTSNNSPSIHFDGQVQVPLSKGNEVKAINGGFGTMTLADELNLSFIPYA